MSQNLSLFCGCKNTAFSITDKKIIEFFLHGNTIVLIFSMKNFTKCTTFLRIFAAPNAKHDDK